MTFAIRPATADDQGIIGRAVRRARLDPSGLDWRHFKVAETRAGEMVGFCQIRRYGGMQELGSLYVRKRYRHQGVGGRLIEACLRNTMPPVYLECVAGRQAYYEGFGFRRIAIWRAPWRLRVKALLGLTTVGLILRKRIIVMRWQGWEADGLAG